MPNKLNQKTRRAGAILQLAAKKFLRIDGGQSAGSFAFDAFFSLFPLMILLVLVVSFFVDRDTAGKEVITYIKSYVPINREMKRYIFDTIDGVIKTREQAGVVALLVLIWSALQCFTTLISATNRAWGTVVHNWWRLPLKSLVFLGITAGAVFTGIAVPIVVKMVNDWLFPLYDFRSWVYEMGIFLFPLLIVFFSLSLFYRLAPKRVTRFTEIWAAALFVTVLLRAGQSLFVIYLKNFATFNAVYGAFGGIMALLLWIYLSGSFVIFGACLCSAQAEMHSLPAKTTGVRTGK